MRSRWTLVLVSLLFATPAVAFWLWMVIVPARVAILCPRECRCGTGGYYVRCESLSINPIPLIHLSNVQVLLFYDNEITLLEKNSFLSMTELLLLDVSWCGLRTIKLGAFNGLTNLRRLTMRGNEISELLTGTFENLKRLEYLYINNNKLQHLDSDVLSGMVNLKSIKLSRNNLQYLDPRMFLRLPNIKQQHIEKNGSLQIPTDRNFINSHSLSFLGSSYYNVSSLSDETFVIFSALDLLDLRYNNLQTVDTNILRALPKLSAMFLNGNPLQCDCQLQEVWRWCEDRNIVTVYDTGDEELVPECDSPSVVKGMGWGVLEKVQCLDGNIEYFVDYNNTNNNETEIGEQMYDYEYKNESEYVYVYEGEYNPGNGYDDEFFKQYQVPIYAVPFIFGTTGNIIILIIIVCNKDMRTVPNMYILNLAISDSIYLTVLFSEACVNRITGMWVEGEFICIFISFCRRMSVGLSAYSVALYSFQRYRIIVWPFQGRVSSQPKWCGIVATLCGLWLLAALFAVPSTISMNLCEEYWYEGILTYYQHVVIFELLVSCVLPLCVIAFTYIMTARHLVESSRSISERTQNAQLNTRSYAAKIVVGLTVVFVISYVPYHVFWTYVILSQENIFSSNVNAILYYSDYGVQYTYLISNCFLSINSCLNPVALICTSSAIRQHLKHYITCFCNTNSPPTDFELARRN